MRIQAFAAAAAVVLTGTPSVAGPIGPTPPPAVETSVTDLYAELTVGGYVLYGRLARTNTCANVRFTRILAPQTPPLPPTRAIVYRAEQFVALRRKTCAPAKELVPLFMTVQDGSPKFLTVVATNYPHGTQVQVQPNL